MKLYNLYQTIILEEIIRLTQLSEAVSSNDIENVLAGDPEKQGKFYHVSFDYKSEDGSVSNRWVQIYQRNISTASNGLIDAYQVSKNGQYSEPNNKKSSLTGWKKFRLDRMSNFKVSKVPFYQEPEPYTVYDSNGIARKAQLNKTGNNSPTVSVTNTIAKIGSYKYADSTLKNKAYAQKRAQKVNQQPVKQEPMAQNINQQPVNQQPMAQKTKVQKPLVQQPIKQPNPELEKDLENKDEINK